MKTTLTILQFLKEIGIDLLLIFPGIAGGFVLANKTEKLSRWQKIATMLSGGLTANYLTPLVGAWLNLSDGSPLYGIAFFLGFGGLKLVENFFMVFQNKVSSSNK